MRFTKALGAAAALCLLLAACLLGGCAALLERSYSAAEPYVDRYWDSGAEDTLRAESYQDLVNSLLLLIEERAEEGIIRCYGDVGEYREAAAAREEVRKETTLGAYLLRDLRISYESGANYSTVTCYMTYREDAEDVENMMTLSDSQSLVDLLRLAVREEHERLTARFSYDMPRQDVTAACGGSCAGRRRRPSRRWRRRPPRTRPPRTRRSRSRRRPLARRRARPRRRRLRKVRRPPGRGRTRTRPRCRRRRRSPCTRPAPGPSGSTRTRRRRSWWRCCWRRRRRREAAPGNQTKMQKNFYEKKRKFS